MAARSASARVPASGDGHLSAAPRAEASVQPYLAQQLQQTQPVSQTQQAQQAYRPAAPSSGEYDEASEYSASASSVSTFTQFLRDYTLRLDPIICAKLRKRTAKVTYGIDGLVNPRVDQERFSLLVKPTPSASPRALGFWVEKVTLNTTRVAAEVFSPKIPLGFLRLQLMVYAEAGKRPEMAFKCSTRWASSGKQHPLKRSAGSPSLAPSGDLLIIVDVGGMGVQYYLRDANINALPKLELRPHVKCDLFVPEVYGRLGGGEDQGAEVERGHAHIRLSRINLRYDVGATKREVVCRHDDVPEAAAVEEEEVDQVDAVVQGLVPHTVWPRLQPHSGRLESSDLQTSNSPSAPPPLKPRRRFGLLWRN